MAAAVWMAAALLLAIDLHAANPVADLRVAAAEDAGGNTTFFFTASTGSSRLYVTNAFEYYMTIGTERITGHGVSLRCGGGEWGRAARIPTVCHFCLTVFSLSLAVLVPPLLPPKNGTVRETRRTTLQAIFCSKLASIFATARTPCWETIPG